MPSRCQSASERPVASSTSSARAIRDPVAGHQPRRHRRIAARELGMQRRGAFGVAAAPAPRRGSPAAIGGTAESPCVSALK